MTSEQCPVCSKAVYPMEKINIDGKAFHRGCFRCAHCKGTLKLGNFTALEGLFYCKPHLIQMFKEKGNYDEGFGREQHKTKWAQSAKASE
ncbi:unnamed protein product [Brachionus calyciflorus]|uniref:LIM zinc-binding domain-containing protein n=1 Tax=Brachionus calyciflorus TaxID=104777 RepID=A0A813X9M0_9BILA|nr:unnamed protein product [Brachionus calyciflorus]